MQVFLEGKQLTGDFHRYIKEALQFPDYYGENLDALFDCLMDICEETTISIAGSDRADPAVLAVFCDAKEENPHIALQLR